MRILVTPTSLQDGNDSPALTELKNSSAELVFNPYGRPLDEAELIPLLADCDGYIAGLDFITRKVMESSHKLKVISRYGVGYDRVDIQAARDNGIIVTNTPGVNAEAVGELTIALLLAVARKIPFLDKDTRNGGWNRSNGIELKGKRILIVGLGAIGKVTGRCAKGLGMEVLAFDPFINRDYCIDNDIRVVDFDNGIEEADVIALHVPLVESTRHLVDRSAFQRMKEGVIIINASRGGIIDDKVAYEFLKNGKIGGLGLDAFEVEPPKDSPLFSFDNVVATPHTGAHTKEATVNMGMMSVNNVFEVLSGKDCKYIVSK